MAGYTFSLSDDRTKQKPTANQPVQEAIKIIALRLPHVVGSAALAPQALLAGPPPSMPPMYTGPGDFQLQQRQQQPHYGTQSLPSPRPPTITPGTQPGRGYPAPPAPPGPTMPRSPFPQPQRGIPFGMGRGVTR